MRACYGHDSERRSRPIRYHQMMTMILSEGAWTEADGGNGTFQAVDPSTGERIEPAYPVCSWSDLDRMAVASTAAVGDPANRNPERIARFLEAYADRLDARREAIATMAHRETGLPLEPRLRVIEFDRMLGQLRQAADAARDVGPDSWRSPIIDEATGIHSDRGPLGGAVLVIGPNNFPLAFHGVSGGDFASAIAAGNPVIAKGHPLHPGTGAMLAACAAEAVADAELHPATVQFFHHCDPEDGLRLIAHPAIAAVGFTGSRAAGLVLKAAADAAGKPSFLEMSSVNPVFALPGAISEDAVGIGEAWAGSILMGAGQFCTKPGILIAVGDDVKSLLDAAISTCGSAAAGILFSAEATHELESGITAMIEAGADVHCGGNAASPGSRFEPTLLSVDGNRFLERFEVLAAERFGPVGLFVAASDVDEAIAIAGRLEGQLTVTMYTGDGDDDAWDRLAAVLRPRCGRLLENKMPTGVAVVPSMVHGGPHPATGHPGFTAVGMPTSIGRFSMARCWDGVANARLPNWLR
ncbi:MAG TPA: ketoglutarate semialdehyde dehydrogenase [Phycisphaerales bacterium]|nr:ketoglutarate semialdehyde dehydrogenase [Phycisphaerales bacterium]